MKLIVEASKLWAEIANVKTATATKTMAQGLLLTATDIITIASSGGNTYAEANVEGDVLEPGLVVMNFNSLDLLQYVVGTVIIELKDNHLNISGQVGANLTIMDTDPNFYKAPTRCVNWIPVGRDFFRILYAVGNTDATSAIHVEGNIFATGTGKSFAGYRNTESVTNEIVAIDPNIPLPRNKSFHMGFVNTTVWYKSENMIAAMPTRYGPNHLFTQFGYYEDITEVGFTCDGDSLIKAANFVHNLSASTKYEYGDGRCSLQLHGDSLLLVAAGNEIGTGEYTLAVQGNGDLEFGMSTSMFKEAVYNVGHDVINIRLAKVSGNQVLIIIGENTRHFIAEDPSARDV